MAKDQTIQFKGTTLKIIHILLASADPLRVRAGLAELTGNTPDFFDNDLAVLDFSPCTALPDRIDWAALTALLKDSGLQSGAVINLPDHLADAAQAHGLPVLAADALARPRRGTATETALPAPPETAPIREEPVATPAPSAAPPAPPPATTILDKPLRSGQRFYARGGDLVVLAQVSAGAEVIADGNIHVYAPLRGRALAGASGNRMARIFTTSLQAELVSIAGIYRTFEAGVPAAVAGQPAVVALEGDDDRANLRLEPLNIR